MKIISYKRYPANIEVVTDGDISPSIDLDGIDQLVEAGTTDAEIEEFVAADMEPLAGCDRDEKFRGLERDVRNAYTAMRDSLNAGPYYIAFVRNYYADQTNLMGVFIVEGDNGRECAFDSDDEARARMSELETETYYTKSGEAGRPTYYVIGQAVRDWLDCNDVDKYDWSEYDGGENDEDAQNEFMLRENEKYVELHREQA